MVLYFQSAVLELPVLLATFLLLALLNSLQQLQRLRQHPCSQTAATSLGS